MLLCGVAVGWELKRPPVGVAVGLGPRRLLCGVAVGLGLKMLLGGVAFAFVPKVLLAGGPAGKVPKSPPDAANASLASKSLLAAVVVGTLLKMLLCDNELNRPAPVQPELS